MHSYTHCFHRNVCCEVLERAANQMKRSKCFVGQKRPLPHKGLRKLTYKAKLPATLQHNMYYQTQAVDGARAFSHMPFAVKERLTSRNRATDSRLTEGSASPTVLCSNHKQEILA
jgi:hypothetical protein